MQIYKLIAHILFCLIAVEFLHINIWHNGGQCSQSSSFNKTNSSWRPNMFQLRMKLVIKKFKNYIYLQDDLVNKFDIIYNQI